ncbi:MAG: hypothetical protein ACI9S8_003081, partial [Chlamydiales bacterium]
PNFNYHNRLKDYRIFKKVISKSVFVTIHHTIASDYYKIVV